MKPFSPTRDVSTLASRYLDGDAATDLTSLDIAQLGSRLRKKKLTPSALVEAHIARIQEVNPALNAVVVDRFFAARAEARQADAVLAACRDEKQLATLGPLFGIPCTVKEFYAVAGLPQTAGILRRRQRRPVEDSEVVKRLRAAGAIVLGITNVPEGGLWMETDNLIYGRTQNPRNARHTPGGSSGGEGAIVAAGGVPFGIGSDIGGSIRIPAAFCGTVGHKPSGGLIPLTGHYPPPLGKSQFLVGGPLCRRVGDVLPILQALAGPDGRDLTCEALPLGDPSRVDLSQLRIFPVRPPLRIAPVMAAAVDEAATALAERGATLARLASEELRGGFRLWLAGLVAAAPTSYGEVLSDGEGIHFFELLGEFLRLPFGKNRYVLASLVMVLGERVLHRLSLDLQRDLDRIERLRNRLDELLGENGVILYPPYSRPAPRHHLPLLRPFDSACTVLWNTLGYPSTVVPLGFDERGLPICVQVIARRGMDHLTLAVAGALEQRFGGWVRAEPAAAR